MRHWILLAGLTAGLAFASGCRHCCKRPLFGRSVTEPVGGFLGSPVAPVPGGAAIPPPNLPTTPSAPPPVIPDSSGSLRVDPSFPPPDFPPPASNRSLPPSPSNTTPRNSTGPELLLPDPLPPKSSSAFGPPIAGLEDPLLPRNAQKPPESVPVPASGGDLPPAPMPAKPGSDSARGTNPVGLPGYTAVADKPGVYAGRRPSLDGFAWLKANGFRTVLFLHAPEADPSAARDLAGKYGLEFESVAVSPETLRDSVERFNGALANRLSRPVYVADDDGWRAGMLWYLHFRTTDLLNDDAARLRARSLGLPTPDSEMGKQFWAAAQQYLANR